MKPDWRGLLPIYIAFVAALFAATVGLTPFQLSAQGRGPDRFEGARIIPTPLFLVSCTHTDVAHRANGQAVSATSATVKTFNSSGSPTGPISFTWIAIGIGS